MPQNKITASVQHLVHEIMTNALWGLVIAIVISLVTNVLTIQYIFSLQDDLQGLVKRDLLGQNYIQAAEIKLLSIEKELYGLFLSKNTTTTLAAIRNVTAEKNAMEALLAKAKPQFKSKKGAGLFSAALKDFSKCEATIDTLIILARAGSTNVALDMLASDMAEQFDAFGDQLHVLDDIKQKRDIKVYKNIDYELSISVLFTVIAVIVTIIIRLFLYWRSKGMKKVRQVRIR
jgi:Four helix bundle sensory module for signal transduction